MVLCLRMVTRFGRITSRTANLWSTIRGECVQASSLSHHNYRSISTTLACYAERLYSDKHEWVLIEGNTGTVGISHYAQDALGDVVYAQLPEIGTDILKRDECGALESVKAASEIYSPISGKVIEKNAEVENTPAIINKACYGEGWLFKLELSNPEELKELMTETEYENFLKTDPH
ncbi:glycine cleavage system H protein, mitochondrial [Periplaneta americana]|uniref:glycine cleavage system H protein, mitochondrial n=1 Tax=Periplaneta americana TaxID=6978 RepID=UPI0037E7F722